MRGQTVEMSLVYASPEQDVINKVLERLGVKPGTSVRSLSWDTRKWIEEEKLRALDKLHGVKRENYDVMPAPGI